MRGCSICNFDYGGQCIPTLLSCCGNEVCFTCAENWRSAQIAELPRNRKKIKCMLCNHLFHCRNDTPWIVNRPFINLQGIDVDMSIVREAQSAMQVSTAAVATVARSNIPQTRSQRDNNDGVDEGISSDVKEGQKSGIHTAPPPPTLGNNSRRSPPPRGHETDINDEGEDNDVVSTLPNTNADSDERHQLLSTTTSIIRRSHRLSSVRTGYTVDAQSDDEDSDEELEFSLGADHADFNTYDSLSNTHARKRTKLDNASEGIDASSSATKEDPTSSGEKEDELSSDKNDELLSHTANATEKEDTTSSDDEDELLGQLIYNSSRTAQLRREQQQGKVVEEELSMGRVSTKKRRVIKLFAQRMDDLRAYKEKHGHVQVKESNDSSLYFFCNNMRHARNNPEKSNMVLNDERMASLDALGFDWTVKEQVAKKSFEQRTADLLAYKDKYGHINVKVTEDISLYGFCQKIRKARNNPEQSTTLINDDRIASLDALGFDWTVKEQVAKKSFEQRIEDLRLYKDKHRHINVKVTEDISLYGFCQKIRKARNNPEKSATLINDHRIASLDALGFDWRGVREQATMKSFEQRIEDLRTYKEKHGHVNVKENYNRSLYKFCSEIRYTRKHPEKKKRATLTEDRIASLDALGFDWSVRSFAQRIEDLRAYKEKHGHIKVKRCPVKRSQDKSLYLFCINMRQARKNPEKSNMITDERIACLDALGFDWSINSGIKSFAQRIVDLKAYKEEHGHVNVKRSENKSLYGFCFSIRYARINPEKSTTLINEERIASLDALGFDWRTS